MSEEEGDNGTYKIAKKNGSVESQEEVEVEAPSKEEAKDLFEFVWDHE